MMAEGEESLRSRIPPPPEFFVPRNEIVNQIANYLVEKRALNELKYRVVVLHGMAGNGKSVVASCVAKHSLVVSNYHQINWIAVSNQTLFELTNSIIRICDPRNYNMSNSVLEAKDYLNQNSFFKQNRILIVLDGMWEADMMAKLLDTFPPSFKFLVTTRNMNIAKVQKMFSVNVLEKSEALELASLCTKIPLSDDDEEAQSVYLLADKCGYSPLGLSIMCLSLPSDIQKKELSTQLKNLAEKMSRNSTGVTGQEHYSIYQAIEISYNMFPENIKPFYLRLAIFPEQSQIPQSLFVKIWETNQQTPSIIKQILDYFVSRSMLSYDRATESYSLHNLLRSFIRRFAIRSSLYQPSTSTDDIKDKKRSSIHISDTKRNDYEDDETEGRGKRSGRYAMYSAMGLGGVSSIIDDGIYPYLKHQHTLFTNVFKNTRVKDSQVVNWSDKSSYVFQYLGQHCVAADDLEFLRELMLGRLDWLAMKFDRVNYVSLMMDIDLYLYGMERKNSGTKYKNDEDIDMQIVLLRDVIKLAGRSIFNDPRHLPLQLRHRLFDISKEHSIFAKLVPRDLSSASVPAILRPNQRPNMFLQFYTGLRKLGEIAAIMGPVRAHMTQVVLLPHNRALSLSGPVITLWDIRYGWLIQSFESHRKNVNGVLQFDASGQFIVSWSMDKTIKLWDLNKPDNLTNHTTYEGHTSWVRGVLKLSEGGSNGKDDVGHRKIVSWGEDGLVILWDLDNKDSKNNREVLMGHEGPIKGVERVGNGELVTYSDDGKIMLWVVEEKKQITAYVERTDPLHVFDKHTDAVLGVRVWNDSGKYRMVSWSKDNAILLWDLQNPKNDPIVFNMHERLISAVHLLSDYSRLVSVSEGGVIGLIELRHRGSGSGDDQQSNHRVLRFENREWQGLYVFELHDRSDSALSKGTIPGEEKKKKEDNTSVESSRDHLRALIWDDSGELVLVDLDNEDNNTNHIVMREKHPQKIKGVYVLPGGLPKTVISWSFGERSCECNLLLRQVEWNSHASSQDTKTGMRQLDTRTRLFRGHKNIINGVVQLSDNQILSYGNDKTMIIWNIDKGSAYDESLTYPSQRVNNVIVLENKSAISWGESASGGRGDITIWDLKNVDVLPQKYVLGGHQGTISDIFVLDGGKRLVSWSGTDNQVLLWTANKQVSPDSEPKGVGEEKKENMRYSYVALQGQQSDLFGVKLLCNGKQLLTWGETNGIRSLQLWDLNTLAQISEQKAVLDGTPVRSFARECVQVLSNEKKVLTWGGENDLLWVWHVNKTNKPPLGFNNHTRTISNVIEFANEWILTYAEKDPCIMLWNFDEEKVEPLKLEHKSPVMKVFVFEDKKRVLSWCDDNALKLWNFNPVSKQCSVIEFGEIVHDTLRGSLVFPNGRNVLSWGERDRKFTLWDMETANNELNRQVLEMAHDVAGPVSNVINYDKKRFISWFDNSKMKNDQYDFSMILWEIENENLVDVRMNGHTQQIIGVERLQFPQSSSSSSSSDPKTPTLISWSKHQVILWEIPSNTRGNFVPKQYSHIRLDDDIHFVKYHFLPIGNGEIAFLLFIGTYDGSLSLFTTVKWL